jgi:hypothetical protein
MSVSRKCALNLILSIVALALAAPAEDLHFKQNISVGGNTVSSSEVWVKGARERSATSSPGGNLVTLRQCDLKRTLTVNEQGQSYVVANDPQDDSAAKAAALFGGAPEPPASGGTITQTVSLTDTGERKQVSGFTARRVKMSVLVESSANACSHLKQKFDIDAWYTDELKEQASCAPSLPPVRQAESCSDRVVIHRKGTGKPGFPLAQNITIQNDDGTTTKIEINAAAISKQPLNADLFDVPASYHQVKSTAELYALPQPAAANSFAQPTQPATTAAPQFNGMPAGFTGQAAQAQQMAAMQQGVAMNAQMQNAMMGMQPGMTGMQSPANAASIPLPQAVGPKAPGKIRIGIAPAQAQLGQGNNAQADYATPIRNAIIYIMNGPAVEIAALDARIPMQLQAEAQQKQCDYILSSSVAVKHAGGGFGKFMKVGSMASNVTPVGMMAHSMGAMAASQAAAQAAAMTAQQQAVSQLSQFNGQIKSKDDVTVAYQLFPTGQDKP